MRSIQGCEKADRITVFIPVLLLGTLVGTAAAQTLPPPSALNGAFSNSFTVTDSAGNLYVAGITNGAGLPVSPNAVQPAYAGGTCQGYSIFPIGPSTFACYDLYVAKLDPTGTQLLAATYLGGTGNELLNSLSVDSQGAVYLAGTSDAVSFLPQSGTPVTGFSSFVAKLSANLDKVNYGVALPASKIAVDSTGNLWALGLTASTPSVPVLSELASSGAVSRTEQISEMATVSALTLDSAGNPVAVGTSQQSGQGMVVRFQTTGQPVSTALFGNLGYAPSAAAVAPDGSVYVVGSVNNNLGPTDPPGGFLAHIAMDGTSQRLLIGQAVRSVAVGSNGKAFAVGIASAGIPTTADAAQRCRSDSFLNVFVAGWDGVSPVPFYATYAGPQSSFPSIVALNASGVLTLTSSLFSAQGPVATHLQPGVSAGQSACIDPLPANLPNLRAFAAADPANVPSAIAAGEYVVFFGSGIGPDTAAQWNSSGSVPTELAGVQLLVGGHPAPLLSVSANQITAIMPLELAQSGTVDVAVESNGTTVATAQVPLTAATPAIFGINALAGSVFNEDFSLNSQTNTAAPGEVLEVFVSGGGALTPSPLDGSIVPPAALPLALVPITAYITGSGAQVVTFAGQAANAAAGLMQVNVRIGSDFAFHGQQQLVISFGTQQAQATFWVQ